MAVQGHNFMCELEQVDIVLCLSNTGSGVQLCYASANLLG